MPSSATISGVWGGIRGKTRTLYWRCPECGTPYEDKCFTVPGPYLAICDLASNHANHAPVQFEVNWAPTPLGGTVMINQHEFLVTDAFCFLFNGNLEIEFRYDDAEGECWNIPFGSAVEFSELTGQSISIADCLNATFEKFKPSCRIDHCYYSISSLHVDAIRYMRESDLLSLMFDFEALDHDSGLTISARAQLTALCRPVERYDVLHSPGSIPIRFAKTYLPLIGLPPISAEATSKDVISVFGQPNHQGGGSHPIFGDIPKCIRYSFPSYYLHFQFERDVVTEVTIMSREGPFAASFPE